MSRLLKDCPQQHSLPGVLPYAQIESVTLVDAKWTQSVQTPNPVALTEFPVLDETVVGKIFRINEMATPWGSHVLHRLT